jgi:hypothetical protein
MVSFYFQIFGPEAMKSLKFAKIISAGALVLALVHLLFPDIKIDAITALLLVVAVIPWLAPIFKSVELPGGLKVEFQEFERVKQEADRAGLLATPTNRSQEPTYIMVAQEDPILALAGLRIEIERRLRSLAKALGIEAERKGIGELLRRLPVKEAISQNELSVLNDLVGLLNRAVHGIDVEARAAQWAIDVGPRLLAALDQRIARYSGKEAG